jgi:hypothetical protein
MPRQSMAIRQTTGLFAGRFTKQEQPPLAERPALRPRQVRRRRDPAEQNEKIPECPEEILSVFNRQRGENLLNKKNRPSHLI